jgi:hypothetical protein
VTKFKKTPYVLVFKYLSLNFRERGGTKPAKVQQQWALLMSLVSVATVATDTNDISNAHCYCKYVVSMISIDSG